MGFLGALLGSLLITGVTQALGGTKSKQSTTTSSTTDPFYALMSPKVVGDVMNRFGAFQNAGMPAGTINTAGSDFLQQDIWKQILKQWPNIKSGLKLA
jgi:hypothetical protein